VQHHQAAHATLRSPTIDGLLPTDPRNPLHWGELSADELSEKHRARYAPDAVNQVF
jgi:hypothetical protein